LGITDPVRVCDTCHFKIENKVVDKKEPTANTKTSKVEEDDDLQKAIQASLQEMNKSQPKPKPAPSRSKEDEDLERAIQESLRLEEDRKKRETVPVRDPWGTSTPAAAVVEPVKLVTPQKPKISSVQIQNIQLFSELVESTVAKVQQQGIHSLEPHSLQSMFAQVSNLHSLLTEKLVDTAQAYKQLYEMNQELQSTIREYDSFVLRRFRGIHDLC
jgi:growth factor-regulated tyrosine kinase substrate